MNLIEKLGLEKCKQIVSDPLHLQMTHVSNDGRHWVNEEFSHIPEIQDQIQKMIRISDLRTEIDHHYYGQSEEKEIEQYAVLSQEKIEGGAMLVGDNSKVVQMVRDITDNCSDIKNHISPNTKVIEG